MTTGGNLTAAAYFNYQWQLELEFAPHRPARSPGEPAGEYLSRAARVMLAAIYLQAGGKSNSERDEAFPPDEPIN